MPRQLTHAAAARELTAVSRRLHARGWADGTCGNFSVVTSREPLTLAISASSLDKGSLTPGQFLRVGADGKRIGRTGHGGSPSAETLLHIEIARLRAAGAVLHTHSIWATLLSDVDAAQGYVELSGYEMLKGLAGVTTHEHVERVPILDNDQDMTRLAGVLRRSLDAHPQAHGVLLRRHGLYTWGTTLADAVRHVEILEFLFETVGRTAEYQRETGNGKRETAGASR